MTWLRPPTTEPLAVPPGTVDVWRACLADVPAAAHALLLRLLSPSERIRSHRIRVAASRREFELARGILRAILSRYLAVHPERIRFETEADGKPRLAAGVWRFSLSHSRDLALYAVAHERDLGIDIERIRPELPARTLAERYFAPVEVAALAALPDHEVAEAFFAIWTCKEAYLKARGVGLGEALDKVVVTLGPGREPHLSHTTREVSGWSLLTLEPARGYAGALAMMGSATRIRSWTWQPGQATGPGRVGG